ncbi:hypothetical protein PAECIP111893_04838 [Paenibacillus plantiphilus]|uniref:Tox-MPTase4 domain-containing protein n=1 Tax=Paenibacillus plantiphilus TaxID=2905650 RepID=A0ABN8H642_9BACL|nr:zincin-like metallopeptidase toxin domain-containing protein [Paenibacillus plantiphilus]CAH1222271.1 hypothetical protein PAECIP111893_04838 [Paenibacillus plantiphilus]
MATWYQGDGFQLKWPYPLKAVRSLRIDRKFNEHATCSFTAMMAEEDAEACIRNGSFADSLMIRKPGEVRDEHWFAGGITSIDIQMEDGIPHVQIEAISRTYAMDMKPVSRSYQNKGLTYTEVIGQLSEKYPKGDAQNVATNPGDTIGELIVQYKETDWQFMKRLASRIGTVILPDVVMDAARVYFGVPDLSWRTAIKSKRYAMIRNCDTYMEIKAHAEGGSADAMRVTDFTSYRVVTEQYCQVGDDVQFKGSMWVVAESVITYQTGMLQYEYLLVHRQSLRRKARLNKAIQGVSLEGRVVKRANNMVKVHLDIDDGHDEQGNWWFPYSPEGNNIFHCLPDEGARIKVYFPSGKEKKAIAVNAVRGGSEEMKAKKVFQKPTTKVFEMPSNAKMELGEDGVLFKQGTVSFHMDQNNIRVKASEDLLIVASNNLNLSGSGAVIDSIKMEATSIAMQTKLDQYIYIEGNQVRIKGNVIRFDKVQKDLGATIQVPLPESQRGEVRTRIAEKVSNDPHASTKARDAIGKLDEKTLKESYQARFSPAAPSKSDDETAAEQEAYKRSYDAYSIGKQEQFLGVVPHAANGIPAAPVQPNKASPMEQIGKDLLNEMALNMVIPQMPDYYSKRMIETPLHYSRFTFQKFVIDPQMQMAELSFLFGAVAIVLVIPTGGTSMYLLAAAEVFLGVAGMVVSTQKMNDLKDGKAFTDPTFLGLNQRTIDILGVGMAGVALLSLMKHGVMKAANKLSNSKQITALDELDYLLRRTSNGEVPPKGKPAGDGEVPNTNPVGGERIEGTGDFDFKEWADMPVSGQVQIASNGQRLISIRDLKMFTKEMNAKNIRVVIDSKGKILPSFADGGFNPKTGQIVLKKEPTYLSAKHESYHAQQWLELGQEKYLKLTILEREEYVYSQIMKNKDLYTSEEILFSQKYIFKLRTGEWPPPGWKGFE